MALSIFVGLLLLVGFSMAGWTVFWLFRYIAVGATDDRTSIEALAPRVRGFVYYVLGQARVIREFGGLLHFFIFWGFLILQAETIEYFVRAFVPDFRLSMFIGAGPYASVLLLQDIFGFLVLVALCIAAVRRYIVRPDHVLPSLDAGIILGALGTLMVTKFLAHGAELAHAASPADLAAGPAWTPIAALASHLFGGPFGSPGSAGVHTVYTVNYLIHVVTVVFLANYIPMGKHLHLLGAMPNVFFRKLEPRGALYPIDLEDESVESFGAGTLEDLTWKQLLDTYACTECGRCEHYCPAFNTGKELNPMMVIHKLKDHIKDKGKRAYQLRPGELVGKLREAFAENDFSLDRFKRDGVEFPELAGGIISAEELMACTTCGACVANCPVLIEHVDTIVDMRRYLVLTKSEIPAELSRTFRNIENSSNPWGVSNSKRGDWAEGLDIPLMSELDRTPEYLFFVGCAGSFDDRQKRVTIAMAKLLRAANVDFAILGPEEQCTGDPARRIGNEYLYWTVASANVETLNKYKVTKVITTCPHCFHTIGKEYPQLGGDYETVHHTKLLNDLMAAGRLRLRQQPARKLVYHDSCYIGRWNNDYSNPRAALAQVPGAAVQEMEWNQRRSLCCGAGGGRMWMEEHQGKRVNVHRADMAIAAGGDAVVVNCPFCMTMLSDGLKQRDSEMNTFDLAEVIAEALDTSAGVADEAAAADPAE
ncbi:MAG: (Fe-S)-binding protein [Myxococcales bacterium]|nr:(Fe-S)-binding protein [Myxococcales bacterium]MCB9520082.1 (Fe-S)-binding protein [Myxococcales bacterium]MCB9531808.1 (Fe-S)-binding protein [Myxococcales bacterium]